MANALSIAANANSTDRSSQVSARCQTADSGSAALVSELDARRPPSERDIVVWTRLHAVEAERAIEVADFGRKKETELASALHQDQRRLGRPTPGNAVFSSARLARRRLLDSEFERRDCRRDEVELTDRADVLAERRALEHEIHGKRRDKVRQHEVRGRRWQCPQVEQLVGEEHRHEQDDRDPFATQTRRPRPRWRVGAPTPVAHEHERTSGAEQVAGRQQRDDQQPAIVDPGEDRGKVGRGEIRAREPVNDHGAGNAEQHQLHARSRVAPAQKGADNGPAQDVAVCRNMAGSRWLGPHASLLRT